MDQYHLTCFYFSKQSISDGLNSNPSFASTDCTGKTLKTHSRVRESTAKFKVILYSEGNGLLGTNSIHQLNPFYNLSEHPTSQFSQEFN